MKILITGASGFIASRLIEILLEKGHDDIRVLTRNKNAFPKKIDFPLEIFQWNPENFEIDPRALENVDTIIHLAGESIAKGRWTKRKKEKLVHSRVKGTKLLLQEISKLQNKPQKFISSSAIGFYGHCEDQILNENSPKGKGFLADLCHSWEELALKNKIDPMKNREYYKKSKRPIARWNKIRRVPKWFEI